MNKIKKKKSKKSLTDMERKTSMQKNLKYKIAPFLNLFNSLMRNVLISLTMKISLKLMKEKPSF